MVDIICEKNKSFEFLVQYASWFFWMETYKGTLEFYKLG